MAVLSPIPSARVRTTTAEKPGRASSGRTAERRRERSTGADTSTDVPAATAFSTRARSNECVAQWEDPSRKRTARARLGGDGNGEVPACPGADREGRRGGLRGGGARRNGLPPRRLC